MTSKKILESLTICRKDDSCKYCSILSSSSTLSRYCTCILPPEYIGPFLFSGVIAGIIGGIIVGSISGSPLGVSGPAAGLAVIVYAAIEDLSAFDIFL